MNTCETKIRKPQALIRLGANSKKPCSNLPSTTATTTAAAAATATATTASTKLKDREITGASQMNKSSVSKSKYSKLSKQNASNISLHGKVNLISKREIRKPDAVKKSTVFFSTVVKPASGGKILTTKHSSTNKKMVKRTSQLPSPRATAKEKIKPDILIEDKSTTEMGIQTVEDEILDHLLIVGDCKVITPSKSVTDEIEKLRKEEETKILGATRKFEGPMQKEEQQLDNLREFLDKSYISRKTPKLRYNILEEDRKLIESMDELLQREKPKLDSITDIKSRIKHKEQELLSLFDRFQKNECFGKTSV